MPSSIYRVVSPDPNSLLPLPLGSSPGDLIIESTGTVRLGARGADSASMSIDVSGGTVHGELSISGNVHASALQLAASSVVPATDFLSDVLLHGLDPVKAAMVIGNAGPSVDKDLRGTGLHLESMIDPADGGHASRLSMLDISTRERGFLLVNNAKNVPIADDGRGAIVLDSSVTEPALVGIVRESRFDIASAPSGAHVIARDLSGGQIVVRRGDTDATDAEVGTGTHPALCVMDDTAYIIAWDSGTDASGILLRYYNATNTASDPIQVTDYVTGAPPILPNLGDNRFAVTFQDPSANTVEARFYSLPVSTIFSENAPLALETNSAALKPSPGVFAYIDGDASPYAPIGSGSGIGFSVSAKFFVEPGNSLIIISVGTSATDRFDISVSGGQLAISLDGTPPSVMSTTTNLDDNTWHSMSVTIDSASGMVGMYIDGVPNGTGLAGLPTATTMLKVGSAIAAAGDPLTYIETIGWEGRIDSLTLHEGQLNDVQVLELHNGGAALIDPATAPATRDTLLAHWGFEESRQGMSLATNAGAPPLTIQGEGRLYFWAGESTTWRTGPNDPAQLLPQIATLPGPEGRVVSCWTERATTGVWTGSLAVRYAVHGPSGELVRAAAWLAEEQVTTVTEQIEPHVAALRDGRFVITWAARSAVDTTTSIYSRIFTKDGMPSPTPTNAGITQVSLKCVNGRRPRVVSFPVGGHAIVWDAERCGYTTRTAHFRRYNGVGDTIDSKEVNVTADLYPQTRCSGAYVGSGRFAVIFLGSPAGEWEVRARRFSVDTGVLGASAFDIAESLVNDPASTVDEESTPQVVSLGLPLRDEGYAILWKGGLLGDRNTIFMRVNNSIGARLYGADIRIGATGPSLHFLGNFSAASRGWVVHVAWDMIKGTEDSKRIYLGGFDALDPSGQQLVPTIDITDAGGIAEYPVLSVPPTGFVLHIAHERSTGTGFVETDKTAWIAPVGIHHAALTDDVAIPAIVPSLSVIADGRYIQSVIGSTLPANVLPADIPMTASCWIRSLESYVPGQQRHLVSITGTVLYLAEYVERTISLTTDGLLLRLSAITGGENGGETYYETNAPHILFNGHWHHVLIAAGFFTGSLMASAYVDGALVSEGAMQSTNPSGVQLGLGGGIDALRGEWIGEPVVFIGSPPVEGASADPSGSFTGNLDGVSIHGDVMNALDVAHMYNMGTPSLLSSSLTSLSLHAWWRFTELIGNTIYADHSGAGAADLQMYRYDYSLVEHPAAAVSLPLPNAADNLLAAAGDRASSRILIAWVNNSSGSADTVVGAVFDASGVEELVAPAPQVGMYSTGVSTGVVIEAIAASAANDGGFHLIWVERAGIALDTLPSIWHIQLDASGVPYPSGAMPDRVDSPDVTTVRFLGWTRPLSLSVIAQPFSGYIAAWGDMARAFDAMNTPLTPETQLWQMADTGMVSRVAGTTTGAVAGWSTTSGELYKAPYRLNAFDARHVIGARSVALMRLAEDPEQAAIRASLGTTSRAVSVLSIDKMTGHVGINLGSDESELRVGGKTVFLGEVQGIPQEPTGFRVWHGNTTVNIEFVNTGAWLVPSSGTGTVVSGVVLGSAPAPIQWFVTTPPSGSEFYVETGLRSVVYGTYLCASLATSDIAMMDENSVSFDPLAATWRMHAVGDNRYVAQNTRTGTYLQDETGTLTTSFLNAARLTIFT